MSGARFDISFDATLKPDADPEQTRARLADIFKLDAQGVARLFSGESIVVKRNIDAATAARYKRVFDEAGAVLNLVLLETTQDSEGTQTTVQQTSGAASESAESTTTEDTSTLHLAPMGGFLQAPVEVKMLELDLSHLSLVPGPDWTLADCQPHPPEIDPPDTSHLRLVDQETRPDDHDTP